MDIKDSFYFKHDYGARNDPKTVKLRRDLGMCGYGTFWAIVEMLHENGGRISNDPENIAWDLRESRDLVDKVLASGVFFVEDGMIGSERVDREREERREAQEAGRDALRRRKRPDGTPWIKEGDRDLVGTYVESNTRRGEERREEDSKEQQAMEAAFDVFWKSYPRKTAKQAAAKAWRKLGPPVDLQARIQAAVAVHALSDQWAKDGGQFIPHAATWLNQRRWEDETKPSTGGRRVGSAAPTPGKFAHLGESNG
jgi:hypothetical protein